MDIFDRVIQKCRTALHEQGRVNAAARRHSRERMQEAQVKLAEIEERISFHVQIREREPGESAEAYANYVTGVKLFRHQLMWQTVAAMRIGEEDDERDAFTRGDL